MSVKGNKEIMRRFYEEVWQKGNLDFADEVFADNYVRHDFRPGNPLEGPAGQKEIASDFRAACPDLTMTLDLILGEDDFVIVRWTARGTNKGEWGNLAPTGKVFTISGANIYRFAQGKVVELWNHRDDLGMMQQLGIPLHGGSKRT
jgi:steroid delta-isomerase-like uncharacterized protein